MNHPDQEFVRELVADLSEALRMGLREIGAGDATVIGSSPVEQLCKSLDGIAEALGDIASALDTDVASAIVERGGAL